MICKVTNTSFCPWRVMRSFGFAQHWMGMAGGEVGRQGRRGRGMVGWEGQGGDGRWPLGSGGSFFSPFFRFSGSPFFTSFSPFFTFFFTFCSPFSLYKYVTKTWKKGENWRHSIPCGTEMCYVPAAQVFQKLKQRYWYCSRLWHFLHLYNIYPRQSQKDLWAAMFRTYSQYT